MDGPAERAKLTFLSVFWVFMLRYSVLSLLKHQLLSLTIFCSLFSDVNFLNGVCAGTLWLDRVQSLLRKGRHIHWTRGEAQTEVHPCKTAWHFGKQSKKKMQPHSVCLEANLRMRCFLSAYKARAC